MDPDTAIEYPDSFRLSDVVPTRVVPAPILLVKMSRLIFAEHKDATIATKRQLKEIFEEDKIYLKSAVITFGNTSNVRYKIEG